MDKADHDNKLGALVNDKHTYEDFARDTTPARAQQQTTNCLHYKENQRHPTTISS